MLKRSAQLPQDKYTLRIGRALDDVFEPTGRRSSSNRALPPVEAADLRIVVISDLHRGTNDRADDFRRCHRAYRAALGWYLEHGYQLWLLGDIEELWENSAGRVIETYKDVLELDRKSTRLNSSHESTSRMPSSA